MVDYGRLLVMFYEVMLVLKMKIFFDYNKILLFVW